MLNPKTQQRELAYVVLIDGIEPIVGSDNCECAVVGGWHIMVRKGQFDVGDPGIYFEIDSKVPNTNPAFAFLEKRNYKIKTQKYTFGGKGNFISQGLLMHAEDFGWKNGLDADGHTLIYDPKDNSRFWYADGEDRFLTKELGVTYADAEDNQRKAPSVDKYKKMAQRHPEIFRKPFVRWLMKRQWGKDIMFFLFGKKKDKKNGWPEWVSKTDEERIECIPWTLKNKDPWVITEKVDGSSTTFTMKRGKRGKVDFYVCSRNVCFDSIDKPCYYETNVYWEMAQKYGMFDVLKHLLDIMPEAEWVTIQGETYGPSVQKNTYDLTDREFRAFNLIVSNRGRLGSKEMADILWDCGVPCVPILDDAFILPDTVEELRDYVNSEPSVINGKIKEGIVCRSQDGVQSFKCVSPEYLLKFHS
ncbi:MAG: hypothetical protein IKR04_04955 [Clostridia bacterium]|nr:hypothetical protein [Clostridia bacterium]